MAAKVERNKNRQRKIEEKKWPYVWGWVWGLSLNV